MRERHRGEQKSSFAYAADRTGARGRGGWGGDDREKRHSNFGSLHALRGFWSGMTRRNDDAAMATQPRRFSPPPPLNAESNLSDRKAGHPRYSITSHGWKNGRPLGWENAPRLATTRVNSLLRARIRRDPTFEHERETRGRETTIKRR